MGMDRAHLATRTSISSQNECQLPDGKHTAHRNLQPTTLRLGLPTWRPKEATVTFPYFFNVGCHTSAPKTTQSCRRYSFRQLSDLQLEICFINENNSHQFVYRFFVKQEITSRVRLQNKINGPT
jgi:hypothetical protein